MPRKNRNLRRNSRRNSRNRKGGAIRLPSEYFGVESGRYGSDMNVGRTPHAYGYTHAQSMGNEFQVTKLAQICMLTPTLRESKLEVKPLCLVNIMETIVVDTPLIRTLYVPTLMEKPSHKVWVTIYPVTKSGPICTPTQILLVSKQVVTHLVVEITTKMNTARSKQVVTHLVVEITTKMNTAREEGVAEDEHHLILNLDVKETRVRHVQEQINPEKTAQNINLKEVVRNIEKEIRENIDKYVMLILFNKL